MVDQLVGLRGLAYKHRFIGEHQFLHQIIILEDGFEENLIFGRVVRDREQRRRDYFIPAGPIQIISRGKICSELIEMAVKVRVDVRQRNGID